MAGEWKGIYFLAPKPGGISISNRPGVDSRPKRLIQLKILFK